MRSAIWSHALASVGGAAVVVALGVLWLRPRERAAAVVFEPAPSASASLAKPARGAPTGRVASGPPSMQHLDPARTNRSPFRAPASPKVRATYDAGAPIAASPIAVGDAVLVATLGGRVALVDRDGHERARLELHERIYGSPLRLGDAIFLGVDRGALVALDERLAVKFKVPTEGDADVAPLAVTDEEVVFSAGPGVFGVDLRGTFRFRAKQRKKVFGAPCLGPDGAAVFGSQEDAVVAFAPDGAERWRRATAGDVDAGCAVGDDGTVYAGDDGKEVLALHGKTGEVRWRHAVPGYVRGALAVARDGAVLVSTYGPTPTVLALDPGDGHELFAFAIRGTGTEEFGIHGSPLEAADGTLVFGAQDDFVYALGPTGDLRWKHKVDGDVDQAVVLIDDALLAIGDGRGTLTLLSE